LFSCFNIFPAEAACSFSLLVQRKQNQKKAHPAICPLRGFPALLAFIGAKINSFGTSMCLTLRATFGRAKWLSCHFVAALRQIFAHSNEGCDARLHRRDEGQRQIQNQRIRSTPTVMPDLIRHPEFR
jgi:hypothetical protein